MMSDAPISDEDIALWQAFTEDIEPLSGGSRIAKELLPDNQPISTAKASEEVSQTYLPEISVQDTPKAPLKEGETGGMNRRTRKDFVQGRRIEATLDLHGMYQEQAHTELIQFIGECVASDKRFALVITGKGKEYQGVLRSQLPIWLDTPPLRAYVIAYTYAAPKHGGQGAFYVFLRK